jgi:hypothetical protein
MNKNLRELPIRLFHASKNINTYQQSNSSHERRLNSNLDVSAEEVAGWATYIKTLLSMLLIISSGVYIPFHRLALCLCS